MANKLLKEDGTSILQEDVARIVGDFDSTAHDALITLLLPSLEAYQNTYILSHPVYFQGLSTHIVTPRDAKDADNLFSVPVNKITSWNDTGLSFKQLPFSVQTVEYQNHEGAKGWSVVFTTSDGVNTFQKGFGYGIPEAATFGWRLK